MCNTTVVIISVTKIVSCFHGIGFKSKKGGLPKNYGQLADGPTRRRQLADI